MTIGDCIRKYRKQKGLTQKELGELSSTSESTIKQYETGKRSPRIEHLMRISIALGVSLDDLTGQSSVDHIHISRGAAPFIQKGIISPDILNVRKELDNYTDAPFSVLTDSERWNIYFNSLNDTGQEEAFKLIELLLEIPRYRRK